MISKADLVAWLDTVEDTSSIAIDDEGNSLVEVDQNGNTVESWLEIGGIVPEEDVDLFAPDEIVNLSDEAAVWEREVEGAD